MNRKVFFDASLREGVRSLTFALLCWVLLLLTASSVRSALDSMGKNIEVTKYTERLVPSTRFVAVDGVAPKVSPESFVAPSASVIGDVTIGKSSRYVQP